MSQAHHPPHTLNYMSPVAPYTPLHGSSNPPFPNTYPLHCNLPYTTRASGLFLFNAAYILAFPIPWWHILWQIGYSVRWSLFKPERAVTHPAAMCFSSLMRGRVICLGGTCPATQSAHFWVKTHHLRTTAFRDIVL